MPAGMRIALLAALASLAAAPAAAHAETREVGCAELRGAVEAAGTEAQTIVLDGMCTKADLGESGIGTKSGADLTLRGAPGTVSGIDGTGMGGALIDATGAAAIALEDLTFEHAKNGSAVHLQAGRATIARDIFLDNTASSNWGAGLYVMTAGAGCPGPGGEPSITVVSSTFTGNTLSRSGEVETAMGGGAYLADLCPGSGAVIEGNTFEGNTVRNEDNATGGSANGGGLFVGAKGPAPPSLTQADNVFAGNRVEGGPTAEPERASFGGGGEWVEGLSLASVRDRFSSNTVSGDTGEPPGGGAGLGLAGGGEVQTFPCGHESPATAVLEDDVLAGNAISGGEASGAAGAAIKLGCREDEGDRLTLLDSTVTANSAPAGGVPGIAGQPGASLTIGNSIVEGDGGGAELGFSGPVAASYSDLCAAGSPTPIAGAGNICATPRLAGPPADIHETTLSPTREAGSNALVPAELATDYYGAPRIAGGREQPTCFEGLLTLAGPVVDMGAAERPDPLVPLLPVSCPRTFARSSFRFPSVSVRPGGVLLLTFHGLSRGTLIAKATIPETKTVVVKVHGKRRRVRRSVEVAYGGAHRLGPLAPVLEVRVVPSRNALGTLHRRRRLTVSLAVTYAANRLFPATQTRTIGVRWIAPARRP